MLAFPDHDRPERRHARAAAPRPGRHRGDIRPAPGHPDAHPPRRTELAGAACDAARRQPDRSPPAAPRSRGSWPRDPPGDPPRGGPSTPRVRRHRRGTGPLPDQLRRPREWSSRGDPLDRRRGTGRRRVRGAPSAHEGSTPTAPGGPAACRRRRCSIAPASWRSSRTSRATSPRPSSATDGVIRLVERNCAIHRVSSEHAAACQAELDLFRELLGTDVQRETHIAAGDRCCTYRIGGATD